MSISKYPLFHGTGVPAGRYLHVSKTWNIDPITKMVIFNKGVTFKYPAGKNKVAEARRARRKSKYKH